MKWALTSITVRPLRAKRREGAASDKHFHTISGSPPSAPCLAGRRGGGPFKHLGRQIESFSTGPASLFLLTTYLVGKKQ